MYQGAQTILDFHTLSSILDDLLLKNEGGSLPTLYFKVFFPLICLPPISSFSLPRF